MGTSTVHLFPPSALVSRPVFSPLLSPSLISIDEEWKPNVFDYLISPVSYHVIIPDNEMTNDLTHFFNQIYRYSPLSQQVGSGQTS